MIDNCCRNVTFFKFNYFLCVCIMMYILSVHTVSFQKTLGMTCSFNQECISNLYCVSGTCDCVGDSYYNSSLRSCFLKKSQGASCSSTTECTSNFTCASGRCDCVGDFYYYNSRSCLPKLDHGTVCRSSAECKGSSRNCTSYSPWSTNKCLCADDFYWTNHSSCISKNNLKIPATNITRETRTVIFVWHVMSQRSDVSYSIRWNGSNKMNAAETGVTVTGLDPGTLYNFSVLTSLPDDGNYQPITVEQPQAPVWTRPDRPGPVSEVQREANSTYKITFGQSNGSVSLYTMNVSTGGSVIETQNSTSTVMYFTKVKPATTYIYVLESYNGNSEKSDPTSGIFTTGPEASGPVVALHYTGVQSQTANVTWQPPSQPNGNITGYLVEVALQNTAGCLYYIKIPCYGCDEAAPNVSAPTCLLKDANITSSSHEYNLQLLNLTLYCKYIVTVRAVNEQGLGEQASVTFQTITSAREDDETKIPVGAIVGGVLGGLALIAVIGVIVYLTRVAQSRREIRQSNRENPETQVTSGDRHTPKQTFSEHIELPQVQENSHIYEEISNPNCITVESASSVRYTQTPRRPVNNVRSHRDVHQDIRESTESPYVNVNRNQDYNIYANYPNTK